jgi:hypothetical protein
MEIWKEINKTKVCKLLLDSVELVAISRRNDNNKNINSIGFYSACQQL